MHYIWWEWMHYAFQSWCFHINRTRPAKRGEKPPSEAAHKFIIFCISSYWSGVCLSRGKGREIKKAEGKTPTGSAHLLHLLSWGCRFLLYPLISGSLILHSQVDPMRKMYPGDSGVTLVKTPCNSTSVVLPALLRVSPWPRVTWHSLTPQW